MRVDLIVRARVEGRVVGTDALSAFHLKPRIPVIGLGDIDRHRQAGLEHGFPCLLTGAAVRPPVCRADVRADLVVDGAVAVFAQREVTDGESVDPDGQLLAGGGVDDGGSGLIAALGAGEEDPFVVDVRLGEHAELLARREQPCADGRHLAPDGEGVDVLPALAVVGLARDVGVGVDLETRAHVGRLAVGTDDAVRRGELCETDTQTAEERFRHGTGRSTHENTPFVCAHVGGE